MFDLYLAHQGVDLESHRRMTVALTLAAMVMGACGAFAWTASHMSISRVRAPRADHILVQAMNAALVPPPPPAAPMVRAGGGEDDADRRETPPDELAPLEPTKIEARRTAGPGPRNGDEHGEDNGIGLVSGPPCPGCPPTTVVTPRVPLLVPRDPGSPIQQPIDVVRSKALASPNPSQKALQRTDAGRRRQGGRNTTAFCVGPQGRVTDVRTAVSHGDPEVDAVCSAAVERWRFTPTLVDGRPRKVCSRVTFDIRFAP